MKLDNTFPCLLVLFPNNVAAVRQFMSIFNFRSRDDLANLVEKLGGGSGEAGTSKIENEKEGDVSKSNEADDKSEVKSQGLDTQNAKTDSKNEPTDSKGSTAFLQQWTRPCEGSHIPMYFTQPIRFLCMF